MADFHLAFSFPPASDKLDHSAPVLFLGSCFSDEIAAKAHYFGFDTASNPFGTIFHPLALSRFLQETLRDSLPTERIIERDNYYFSWDASSLVYGNSPSELSALLREKRSAWREKLARATHLFITFGSAWGYLNTHQELVANCHKFPSQQFTKVLSEGGELLASWKETLALLRTHYPQLNIVFTVSPVRHSRDGLVENNRNKALLIELTRQLEQEHTCSYFPSYEIVLDELRDYRFYTKDRVHPNEEAIDYVWERFSDTYFSEATKALCNEVRKYRLAAAHRSHFPDSDSAQAQQANLARLKEVLSGKNVVI